MTALVQIGISAKGKSELVKHLKGQRLKRWGKNVK